MTTPTFDETVKDVQRIRELYARAFGGRDRTFCRTGLDLMACDDGGGFMLFDAHPGCESDDISDLVIELLNFAARMSGC